KRDHQGDDQAALAEERTDPEDQAAQRRKQDEGLECVGHRSITYHLNGRTRGSVPASHEDLVNPPIGPLVVVPGVDVEPGYPLAAEHLHVTAIVLDRQTEVESVGPEVPDGGLLELAGEVVIAPGSHQQQVPADLVPVEPRLGEVVDA